MKKISNSNFNEKEKEKLLGMLGGLAWHCANVKDQCINKGDPVPYKWVSIERDAISLYNKLVGA